MEPSLVLLYFKFKYVQNNRRGLRKQRIADIPPIVDGQPLPPPYRVTLRARRCANPDAELASERWLLAEDDALLVFGSDDDVRRLYSSPLWVMDGTFDVAPRGFTQLVTIHGFINGEAKALLQGLLRDKRQASYERMLRALQDKAVGLQLQPHQQLCLLVDYEAAERNAFAAVYPTARVQGCLFHYGQALNRNLGTLGLRGLYRQVGGGAWLDYKH
jgi:hypothetical protein